MPVEDGKMLPVRENQALGLHVLHMHCDRLHLEQDKAWSKEKKQSANLVARCYEQARD